MSMFSSCFGKPEKAMSDADRHMEETRISNLCSFKVLLLGAGESGKSTVLKQIKLVQKIQFTPEEMRNFGLNLRRNTIQSMQTLVEAFTIVTDPPKIEDPVELEAHNTLKNFEFEDEDCLIPDSIQKAVTLLWKSAPIAQILERRNEFWCLDSVDYYFDNMERFCEDDFYPDEEDCVRARVITTGIVTTNFDARCISQNNLAIHYTLIDVGGQRNERRKWMHCFDDVSSICYIVNLAGYQSVLYEDHTVNRLKESLEVFEKNVNNETFGSVPIFLLLNKKDLFEMLIRKKPLKDLFPDYSGGDDALTAIAYIESLFRAKLTNNPERLKCFSVSARVKVDIRDTWAEIDTHLQEEAKNHFKEAIKGQEKLDRLTEKGRNGAAAASSTGDVANNEADDTASPKSKKSKNRRAPRNPKPPREGDASKGSKKDKKGKKGAASSSADVDPGPKVPAPIPKEEASPSANTAEATPAAAVEEKSTPVEAEKPKAEEPKAEEPKAEKPKAEEEPAAVVEQPKAVEPPAEEEKEETPAPPPAVEEPVQALPEDSTPPPPAPVEEPSQTQPEEPAPPAPIEEPVVEDTKKESSPADAPEPEAIAS